MSLTEIQKNWLQWIVTEVRDGQLTRKDREEIHIIRLSPDASIQCPSDDSPGWSIPLSILDLLTDRGYLNETKISRDKYIYALTEKAKEMVASNFDEPDRSAIRHLIPLTEVQHLDPELWERCRISLSAGGNDPKAWDKAVRTATVVLEERLRKLGNTDNINPDATGEGLVNQIFGEKSPLSIDNKKRKAYRDLYAGMMSVFRNPYAHRFQDPSPEDGGKIIGFIDLLLKMLDDFDREPE